MQTYSQSIDLQLMKKIVEYNNTKWLNDTSNLIYSDRPKYYQVYKRICIIESEITCK
jgi:hypothetical protein